MSQPNNPHKLTKAAERWLGGGAAFGRLRTARRHGGCTSLPPRRASVAAATIPLRGRRGRRALQLRVITLGRPPESRVITAQIERSLRVKHERHRRLIASFALSLAAPQGEKRAATSKTRHRRSDTSGT